MPDIGLVIVAGLGFAGFFLGIARSHDAGGAVWWPLLYVRAAGLALVTPVVVGAVATGRLRGMHVRRRALLVSAVAGVGDLGGNLFYLLASATGELSVAVVLSSMYPVQTALLARLLVHERLSRVRMLGVAMAVAGIGLVSVGQLGRPADRGAGTDVVLQSSPEEGDRPDTRRARLPAHGTVPARAGGRRGARGGHSRGHRSLDMLASEADTSSVWTSIRTRRSGPASDSGRLPKHWGCRSTRSGAGNWRAGSGSSARAAGSGSCPSPSLTRLMDERRRQSVERPIVAQSARNRFPGIVTRIEKDGVAAVVEVLAGPHRLVSLMTSEAVDDMGLQVGDEAVCVVKATNVIVDVPASKEWKPLRRRPADRQPIIAVLAIVLGACGAWGGAGSPSTLVASAVAGGSEGPAGSLTVFGAASLKDVLADAATKYPTVNLGVPLTVATGSSTALETQIEQGAPADVFLSADTANPQKLIEGQLGVGPAVAFASNVLTVIVPAGNPAGIDSPMDLARPGVKVVAAGDAVPITRYAVRLVANLALQPGYPPDFAAAYEANVGVTAGRRQGGGRPDRAGRGDAGDRLRVRRTLFDRGGHDPRSRGHERARDVRAAWSWRRPGTRLRPERS